MAPPNILFLTTDQQRWDFFDNCYVESLRTPTIQRLMREGTTLTHAYTNCPVCMPTRFTWLHGLYTSQAHARLMGNGHDWPEPERFPTMTQALRNAGYRTALMGKLHSVAGLWHRDIVADELHRTRARGFDDVVEVCGKSLAYWYDCSWTRYLESNGLLSEYRTHLRRHEERSYGWRGGESTSVLAREDTMDAFIARNCVAWLNEHAADSTPWFLHASFCGPHFPLDALPEYLQHYDPKDMPPPEGVEDPQRVKEWQRRRAHYCAVIEHLDSEMGTVLDALDGAGQAGNTLVVLTTDHGDMMGHRNRSNKGAPEDTSCRTPVIVRWPGKAQAGATSEAMTEAVDLPCTMLDAAGVESAEAQPNTPGRSFLPCIRDTAAGHRDWVYAESPRWRMCRERDWKYVLAPDGNDRLYDMANDPWEEHDLIDGAGHAGRISRMRRGLLQSMLSCVAPDSYHGDLPRHDWFDAFLPPDFQGPPEPWDR